MFGDMSFQEILKLFAPVIILQFALMAFCLYKLRKDKVKYLPKWGWFLIIIFFNLIGPIIYLLIGRERE